MTNLLAPVDSYLVVSRNYKAFGTLDLVLFWRPQSKGYTAHVKEAGRFSRSEAMAIQESSHGEHMAVKEADVTAKAISVFRREDLPFSLIPHEHAFGDRS